MTCNLDITQMDENKLPQLAGDLYIAACDAPGVLINFGGVKSLESILDNDADRIDIKVNNRAGVTGASIVPQMNVEFLETVDIEKLALLYNLTAVVVPGTLVTGATQTLPTGLTDLVAYPLEKRNGNKTAASITSITGSVDGLLVEDDDFTVTVNAVGETLITFDVTGGTALTTMTQTFAVVYDYTPAAHTYVEGERKYASDRKFRAFIVTEANAAGQYNVISLSPCIFKGQYGIDIADLATAGDLKGSTGTFEGQRGSKIKYEIQTITA